MVDMLLQPNSFASWITVIVREQNPIVRVWDNEIEARAHFSTAELQWSESFLARVIVGPGLRLDSELEKNHLADLARTGMVENTKLRSAIQPLVQMARQIPDLVPDDELIDGITAGMLRKALSAFDGNE